MKIEEASELAKDGHMITFSGKMIKLFDPDPSLIDVNDIAHHLSITTRWGGASGEVFSVAQHCVMGLDICRNDRRGQWLLHDAEEAYFGDIITPVKHLFPELDAAMIRMRKQIFKALRVQYIYDEEIKRVDAEMLKWDWDNVVAGNYKKGLCWDPTKAEDEFLKQYFMYC